MAVSQHCGRGRQESSLNPLAMTSHTETLTCYLINVSHTSDDTRTTVAKTVQEEDGDATREVAAGASETFTQRCVSR